MIWQVNPSLVYYSLNIIVNTNMSRIKDYNPQSLPFSGELEGMSEKTIQIHHDKLYVGYVNKMNEIDEKLAEIAHGEREVLGNQTYSELRALRRGETFATNGTYLHEYYFNVLGGDGSIPENELMSAIIEKWDSFENFKKYFSESAMAVRGWLVLSWDVQLGRLKVYGCDTHDEGGVWGCLPIFALDVFEHAYFIDHGSDRKAYIEAFWKNMDWNKANEIFVKWNGIKR